jgi:hypothetical protein
MSVNRTSGNVSFNVNLTAWGRILYPAWGSESILAGFAVPFRSSVNATRNISVNWTVQWKATVGISPGGGYASGLIDAGVSLIVIDRTNSSSPALKPNPFKFWFLVNFGTGGKNKSQVSSTGTSKITAFVVGNLTAGHKYVVKTFIWALLIARATTSKFYSHPVSIVKLNMGPGHGGSLNWIMIR